jgi:hypothetical protein
VNESALWTRTSYAYAALAAATLGYFLLRIPIQVTDSFLNILALDAPFVELMRNALSEPGYLRPGLWASLKGVYDLSGGDYFTWFRWTQALQAGAVILLFVRLVQPRAAAHMAVVPLAIAVLVGSHNFAWTVLEAFPINTFLTILVCTAAAANLAFADRRWWTDVLAVLLCVAAALTVESGLLLWVIFIGGYAIGLRGISGRAVVVLLILLAGYLWLRFMWLDAGLPDLTRRDAGYGFRRYGGAELQQMFGGGEAAFYAYNVVASLLNVLLGEPRDGVWQLVRAFVQDGPKRVLLVEAGAGVLATAVIGRYIWRRRHAWLSRTFDRSDRLVLLFGFVLVANAAICYAYTKDVIMSPAGFFFAAAAFVSCTDLIAAASMAGTRRLVVAALVLVALSGLWGMRAVGIHVALHRTAQEVRDEWACVDDFLTETGADSLTPRQLAMKHQLQDDAVRRHPATPLLRNEWMRRVGALGP